MQHDITLLSGSIFRWEYIPSKIKLFLLEMPHIIVTGVLAAYPQQESHVAVAAPDSADMHDHHIISARSTDDKCIED